MAGCASTQWPQAGSRFADPASPFPIGPYILSLGDQRFAIVVEALLTEAPVLQWSLAPPDASRRPEEASSAETPTSETEQTEGAGDAASSWPEREGPTQRTTMQNRAGLWVGILRAPTGRRVDYRVDSSIGLTPVYRFKAGAKRGTPFRFAVYGDTRTGHQVHRDVVEAVAKEHIDFVVHTGDLMDDGGRKEQWQQFFAIESPVLTRHPILVAVGNHDESTTQQFRRYFLSDLASQNRRYWWRDWGDLRLIAIDPLEECRDGCIQFAELAQFIRDGAAQNMLMALMVHVPPYSSGAHGSNKIMQSVIKGVGANRYGVEVVFSGHDHNYERTHPIDGVTYVVAASAGAPIRPVDPQSFTAAIRTEPHYALVDVDERGLTLRAINLKGASFDHAVIPPVAPKEDAQVVTDDGR